MALRSPTANAVSEAPEGAVSYAELSRLVEGKNINPKTLLATDYLNHFNEIVMFLDMIPDMPEMIDEVKEWQPKSYQTHFAESVFSHKDLAILGYENSPPEYRLPFDDIVAQMEMLVAAAIPIIEAAILSGDNDRVGFEVQRISVELQQLMDSANAFIHGNVKSEESRSGDKGLETDGDAADWGDLGVADNVETTDQDEIDALFA